MIHKREVSILKREKTLLRTILGSKDFPYLSGLLLLTVIFFGKIIFGPRNMVLSSFYSDTSTAYFAWRHFVFHNLAKGILPLWNPYVLCGTPFMAMVQPALFYPLNFIYLILPTYLAVNCSIILHVFLSGVFFYYFIRYFNVERFGAFISALVYMFAAIQVSHIYAGHLCILSAVPWIPLLFLFLEKYFREHKFSYIILGGVVLALQLLSGSAQATFYSGIGLFLYFLFRIGIISQEERKAKNLVSHCIAFSTLAGIGLLLTAIQLIPSLELIQYSVRQKLSYAFCGTFSFPPENLITFFTPEIFGNNIQLPYWGRCYLWEMCAYLSILPLIFALWAVILKRDKYAYFFAGLAFLSIILALGKYTPLFKFLYYHIPGFNLFRGNSKFIILTTFSLAALCGLGIQSLLGGDSFKRKKFLRFTRILLMMTVILVLLLGVFLVREWNNPSLWKRILKGSASLERQFTPPPNFHNPHVVISTFFLAARSIIQFLGYLLASTLFLFCYIRKKVKVNFAQALIFLLITSDLWLFGLKYLVTFPVKTVYLPKEVADFLYKDRETYRILTGPGISPNQAMLHQLANVSGYEGILIRWYNEFINFSQEQPLEYPQLTMQFSKFSPLLNLLNIKYLLLPSYLEVRNSRFTPVFHSPQIAIYRNSDFLPRVFIVHRAKIIQGRDNIFEELANPTFNPRNYVILEDSYCPPVEGLLSKEEATPPFIVEYLPEKIVVNAELNQSGYLILADTYYPGWKAYVDGYETKIYKANYIMRAVALPKGRHLVEFRYQPFSFKIGAGISLATIAFVAGFLVWETGRYKRLNISRT